LTFGINFTTNVVYANCSQDVTSLNDSYTNYNECVKSVTLSGMTLVLDNFGAGYVYPKFYWIAIGV
jgi:hypothetical protein